MGYKHPTCTTPPLPPTTKTIGRNFVFLPLIFGYPQTCLKIEGRVTQTSVVAVLVHQSTHAIFHNQVNLGSNDVLHDAVDKIVISTHTLKHFFLLQNN